MNLNKLLEILDFKLYRDTNSILTNIYYKKTTLDKYYNIKSIGEIYVYEQAIPNSRYGVRLNYTEQELIKKLKEDFKIELRKYKISKL